MTDEDEIVAYWLEIAGTKADAERAADEWGVRIHILSEEAEQVNAVCPAEDANEIFAWHEHAMPHLQRGEEPHPGDLLRVEQPPTDDKKALDFTGEAKKQAPITSSRKIVYDEL